MEKYITKSDNNIRITTQGSNLNFNIPNKQIIIDNISLDQKKLRKHSDSIATSDQKYSQNLITFNIEKDFPKSNRKSSYGAENNLNDIYMEDSKSRKDIFGREIRKKGKHKISFVDDLDMIKSLMPENGRNNKKKLNNKTYFSSKNLRQYLPEINIKKRFNSVNEGRHTMLKNIYNMTKIKTKSNIKFKESNVHIIAIENLKKETKLNTYLIKKINPLPDEENVICSCYCSIW